MQFAFILSMPNNNAWNGKWSGNDLIYARVRSVQSQKGIAKLTALVGRHSHSFGDGWRACVEVRQVDRKEAARLRKASQGFCGYDWMIETLTLYGKIMNTPQLAAYLEAQRNEAAIKVAASATT